MRVEVALLVQLRFAAAEMLTRAMAEPPPADGWPTGNGGKLQELDRILRAAIDARAAAKQASKTRRHGGGHAVGSRELTNEEKAIGMLVAEPSISIEEVAQRLGVHRTTPYRWHKFIRAWIVQHQTARQTRRRGTKARGQADSAVYDDT
jgi:transposase-like protein